MPGRREMIPYPELASAGRPAGGGPTGSRCKAATRRLKGLGRRWDGDNAEAVLASEALDQSGAGDGYWATFLAQAV